MQERDWLAARFEEHRIHLQTVAYRMLGSISEAEDAVQESWLRLSRTDTAAVANMGGWLTTVVGRVCLDMLRSRKARREDPLDVYIPDPIVHSPDADPETEAILADSVGLALLVVLQTLAPAERLAFVLHDMFAVPFEEIGIILERSPNASKQLASRARRRLQGATTQPDADRERQREVVDAFVAAARDGDFQALVAVLHPDVVLRADAGSDELGASSTIRGSHAVAARALTFARFARSGRPALVNGAPGLVTVVDHKPFAIMGFTITDSKIVELDILADPIRLASLDLTIFDV